VPNEKKRYGEKKKKKNKVRDRAWIFARVRELRRNARERGDSGEGAI